MSEENLNIKAKDYPNTTIIDVEEFNRLTFLVHHGFGFKSYETIRLLGLPDAEHPDYEWAKAKAKEYLQTLVGKKALLVVIAPFGQVKDRTAEVLIEEDDGSYYSVNDLLLESVLVATFDNLEEVKGAL